MELTQRLSDVAQSLREGRFANEQSISQGIVLPVLSDLGWEVFDTSIIWPEYATGEGRVDFALCDPPSKPKCFLEVKQPGKAEDGVRQALNYAFHTGVQFVVLTDGETWSFYLPAEQGSYEERRVYKLDILEQTADQASEALLRYLHRDNIASGKSLETAREEYKSKNRRARAREAIPEAWRELVSKGDELLTELVADAVESKVGIRPDDYDTASFLGDLGSMLSKDEVTNTLSGNDQLLSPNPALPPAARTRKRKAHAHGTVVVLGESFEYASGKDALVTVLREMAKRDASFLERCSRHRAFSGRKRKYIARNIEDLYPGRPDFHDQHDELPGGWLVGTHSSNRQKKTLIEAAAQVGGLTLGTDLVVDLA